MDELAAKANRYSAAADAYSAAIAGESDDERRGEAEKAELDDAKAEYVAALRSAGQPVPHGLE